MFLWGSVCVCVFVMAHVGIFRTGENPENGRRRRYRLWMHKSFQRTTPKTTVLLLKAAGGSFRRCNTWMKRRSEEESLLAFVCESVSMWPREGGCACVYNSCEGSSIQAGSTLLQGVGKGEWIQIFVQAFFFLFSIQAMLKRIQGCLNDFKYSVHISTTTMVVAVAAPDLWAIKRDEEITEISFFIIQMSPAPDK